MPVKERSHPGSAATKWEVRRPFVDFEAFVDEVDLVSAWEHVWRSKGRRTFAWSLADQVGAHLILEGGGVVDVEGHAPPDVDRLIESISKGGFIARLYEIVAGQAFSAELVELAELRRAVAEAGQVVARPDDQKSSDASLFVGFIDKAKAIAARRRIALVFDGINNWRSEEEDGPESKLTQVCFRAKGDPDKVWDLELSLDDEMRKFLETPDGQVAAKKLPNPVVEINA